MKRSVNFTNDILIPSLEDTELAAEYLNVSLESGDIRQFLRALQNVVKAHGGVSAIAKKAHKGRNSLYKTLSEEGNPLLKGAADILSATGLRFTVEPIKAVRTSRRTKTIKPAKTLKVSSRARHHSAAA